MYYVYILRSQKTGTFYIGCTSDLAKRIREHNAGKTKSTKSRRPYSLVHHEIFENKKEALSREYALKHNSKKKALLLAQLQDKVS